MKNWRGHCNRSNGGWEGECATDRSCPSYTFLESADGGEDFQHFYRGVGWQLNGLNYGLCDRGGGDHFLARRLGPESVPYVGVSSAGEERNYSDSFGAKFLAESVGEAERSVLRSGVGARSRKNAGSGDGEIIHDGAAAFHDGEGGLGDQECAVEIGFEDIFPDRKRKFFDREILMGDAGVIDEDVEAAKFAARGAEESIDGVGIADVAGVREYVDFGRGQFPVEFFQRGFIAGSEDQIAPFGGEGSRDSEADASGGAGD